MNTIPMETRHPTKSGPTSDLPLDELPLTTIPMEVRFRQTKGGLA